METSPSRRLGRGHSRAPKVGEPRPSDRLTLLVREDQALVTDRMGGQVRRERFRDDVGERDRPVAAVGLQRPEHGLRSRQQYELSIDLHLTAEEVNPVDGQAEALSLAESGSGREDDEGAVTRWHGLDERLDDVGWQRFDPLDLNPWQFDVDCRARGDQSVGDGGTEDRDDVAVDEFDRGRGEDLRSAANPSLDLTRPDGAQRTLAEVGDDVPAEVRLDLSGRRRAMYLVRPPGLRVLVERHLAALGVDVGPRDLVCLDLVQEPGRVALLGERLGPGSAVRRAPARTVTAVRQLLAECHVRPPSRAR